MRLPLALLALLTLAFAGCSDSPDSGDGATSSDTMSMSGMEGGSMAPMTMEVMAMNSRFDPAEVTVHVGDTVHWVDHDTANPHNVVSTSKGNEFRSPDMDAALPLHDREFSHTFATAGTVDYLCEYHSGMVGKVIVVE